MIVVRRVIGEDISIVKRLLAGANLQSDHLAADNQHYFVVENPKDQVIIGTIGMETYEKDGLLRSFVMERHIWDVNMGLECIGVLLTYAKQLGLAHIYLVTLTAQEFFAQLGFVTIPFAELPQPLHSVESVKKIGSEGVVMMYRLYQH